MNAISNAFTANTCWDSALYFRKRQDVPLYVVHLLLFLTWRKDDSEWQAPAGNIVAALYHKL